MGYTQHPQKPKNIPPPPRARHLGWGKTKTPPPNTPGWWCQTTLGNFFLVDRGGVVGFWSRPPPPKPKPRSRPPLLCFFLWVTTHLSKKNLHNFGLVQRRGGLPPPHPTAEKELLQEVGLLKPKTKKNKKPKPHRLWLPPGHPKTKKPQKKTQKNGGRLFGKKTPFPP